jgi:hypothetical protein
MRRAATGPRIVSRVRVSNDPGDITHEAPFMPEYGDTKMCTARRCTGTMAFRRRRPPNGPTTTVPVTWRSPLHYEAWVCNRCGHEERASGHLGANSEQPHRHGDPE